MDKWKVPAILAAMTIAVLPLLPMCGPAPGGHDYHGGPTEVGEADAWRVPDLPAADRTSGPDTGTELPDSTGEVETAGETSDDQIAAVDRVRECTAHLSFTPPDDSAVFVAGEFTGWADGQVALADDDGDGTWELDLDLTQYAPGSYGYKFHTAADGWFLDPSNPLAKWVDEVENSKLLVPDCNLPDLKLAKVHLDPAEGTLKVRVEVYNSPASSGLNAETASLLVNGEPHDPGFDPSTGTFEVELTGLKNNTKQTLVFALENEYGEGKKYLPLWLSSEGWNWTDAAIYFAFTDRFANGDAGNDAPGPCTETDSTNWSGGDFAGITQKLEEGYFDTLGIDVLWLSPVIDNPNGCCTGTIPGVIYTSYHGYFPLDINSTEDHFGTMAELKALVSTAHARGIKVIVDFVANHVHEECSLWQEHSDDGWFHESYPCEPAWDKLIECWFQPYLPDLDYTNDEVVETMTDNAIFWIMETEIDGFRVDAVKHMVHNFMRTLRWKIAQQIETTGVPFYMVGETFTGDWGGGSGAAELAIKEFISPWELNGQFDFPFYWKILRAVARDEGDFSDLFSFVSESEGFYGEDALMVSFIGNHDVPRFVSHAAGQIEDVWGNGSKEQGLYSPPAQPTVAEPYLRLRLALGLMFALPEIPLIYYGDEVGLAGAGDPDNRRLMVFEGLSDHQAGVLEWTGKVGAARRQLAPLRRGDLETLVEEPDFVAFRRNHDGKTVIVAANRTAEPVAYDLALPSLEGKNLADFLSGDDVAVEGEKAQLSLPPFGLAFLVVE